MTNNFINPNKDGKMRQKKDTEKSKNFYKVSTVQTRPSKCEMKLIK